MSYKIYSKGKAEIEQEAKIKAELIQAIPDLAEFKKTVDNLKSNVAEVERVENAFVTRKAELQDMTDALYTIRRQTDAFTLVIAKFDALATQQKELNTQKLEALTRLNKVLSFYQG
jgi:hypothetical protein